MLVTGCDRARGMGHAISVAFARAGADVVATDVAPRISNPSEPGAKDQARLGFTQ